METSRGNTFQCLATLAIIQLFLYFHLYLLPPFLLLGATEKSPVLNSPTRNLFIDVAKFPPWVWSSPD